MKFEHVAVATRSEADSDRFFGDLLGMDRTRAFTIPPHLTRAFFGLEQDQRILRYEKDGVAFEVFVAGSDARARDPFTHACVLVTDRDAFASRAETMGYAVTKVPRDAGGYFLFVRDAYGNLYEVKAE